MSQPKAIRSILEQTLKALDMRGPLKTYSLWGSWREVVGESIAAQSQPRAVRNRILFLDVSHPTWIQQLQFLKPTLLEKINAFVGDPAIQDIRFRLGRISSTRSHQDQEPLCRSADLDSKTVKHIETLLETIQDEETRRILRDVLVKGAKLERSRQNK